MHIFRSGSGFGVPSGLLFSGGLRPPPQRFVGGSVHPDPRPKEFRVLILKGSVVWIRNFKFRVRKYYRIICYSSNGIVRGAKPPETPEGGTGGDRPPPPKRCKRRRLLKDWPSQFHCLSPDTGSTAVDFFVLLLRVPLPYYNRHGLLTTLWI